MKDPNNMTREELIAEITRLRARRFRVIARGLMLADISNEQLTLALDALMAGNTASFRVTLRQLLNTSIESCMACAHNLEIQENINGPIVTAFR